MDYRQPLTAALLFNPNNEGENIIIEKKINLLFELFDIEDSHQVSEDIMRNMVEAVLVSSKRQASDCKWQCRVESVMRRLLPIPAAGSLAQRNELRQRLMSSAYIIEAFAYTPVITRKQLLMNEKGDGPSMNVGHDTEASLLLGFGANDHMQLEFLFAKEGMQSGIQEEENNAPSNDDDDDDNDADDNDAEDDRDEDETSERPITPPPQLLKKAISHSEQHRAHQFSCKRHIYKLETFANTTLNSEKITQVAAGGQSSYLLTSEGRLFVCGDSQDLREIETPFRVLKVWAAFSSLFIQAADYSLYALGSNSFGQLGTGVAGLVTSPHAVDTGPMGNGPIVQVAIGEHHTLFLTESGQVFACGRNESQCGVNIGWPLTIPHPVDVPCEQNESIVKIVCGKDHSVVLLNSGRVLVCGNNATGATGLGENLPEPIEFFTALPHSLFDGEKIKDVCAGVYHTLFLTESGRVYACGQAAEGQLGIGRPTLTPISSRMRHRSMIRDSLTQREQKENTILNSVFTPKLLRTLEDQRITKVACGEQFSLFLTKDNILYGCGILHLLGVGVENDFLIAYQPVKISQHTHPIDIVCGHSHTIYFRSGLNLSNGLPGGFE